MASLNERISTPPFSEEELTQQLRLGAMLDTTQSLTVSRFLLNAAQNLEVYTQSQLQEESVIERRNGLVKEMKRYKSLQAPIRCLPSEILLEIFRIISDSYTDIPWFSQIEWVCPAFVFTSTCAWWREVAIGSPTLWSNINIALTLDRYRAVDVCLLRSGNSPLTIRIYAYGDPRGRGRRAIFSLLKQHSHRWITLHSIDLTLYRLSSDDIDVPMLSSGTYIPGFGADVLEKCRSLNSLKTIDHSLPPRRSPWTTILHLTVDDSYLDSPFESPSGLVDFLIACPNLISLVYNWFNDYNHFYDISPVPNAVGTSNIRSLILDFPDEEYIAGVIGFLFTALDLPSLQTLVILGRSEFKTARREARNPIWPINIISFTMACLERSHSSLVKLELIGLPLPENNLVSLLMIIPTLEDLAFTEFAATEGFIDDDTHVELKARGEELKLIQTVTESFLEELEKSTMLPRLKRLRLGVHEHFDADLAFVLMVESRWKDRRVREVELLALYSLLDEELYEPLELLERHGGMMVTVRDAEGYVV